MALRIASIMLVFIPLHLAAVLLVAVIKEVRMYSSSVCVQVSRAGMMDLALSQKLARFGRIHHLQTDQADNLHHLDHLDHLHLDHLLHVQTVVHVHHLYRYHLL